MKKLHILRIVLSLGAIFCLAKPTFAYNVYTYTGNEFITHVPLVYGTSPPALPYANPTNLTISIALPDNVSLSQFGQSHSDLIAVTASDGSGYAGAWGFVYQDAGGVGHNTFELSPEGLPTSWDIYLTTSWDYNPPGKPYDVFERWVCGIQSTQVKDTSFQVIGDYGYEGYGSFSQRSINSSISGNPGVWSIEHFPDPPPPVPLPSAVFLLGSGLLGLVGWRNLGKAN